ERLEPEGRPEQVVGNCNGRLQVVGRHVAGAADRERLLARSRRRSARSAARRVRRRPRKAGRLGGGGVVVNQAALAAPASPYKGLAPFEDTDLDALLFFGRESDSEVLAA